jgi:hypothetical protein
MQCILLICCFLGHLDGESQVKKDSVWIQTADGCKVFNPHPVRSETIKWTGKCHAGYATGEGILTWFKNGQADQQYFGGMKRGMPSGKGKYIYSRGDVFEGEYFNGELHGKGRIVLRNRDSIIVQLYTGNFNKGAQNGFGEEIIFDDVTGDTSQYYSGDFYDDERHGPGLLKDYRYNKLTIAKGNFEHNDLEGKAEIWDYSQKKLINYFIGNFENDKRNGYGEDYILGNKYLGEWKNDQKEGKGKLFMDSILIYDGEWKNGLFHGVGKRHFFNGSVYFGEFKNNQRYGIGVLTWKDGTKYVGEFKNDLYMGLGYILKNEKILFAGHWQNGSLFSPEEYLSIRKKLERIYKEELQKFDINLSLR